MVGEESEKKPQKKKNAGAYWSVKDEKFVIKAMEDHVKRGKDVNSKDFHVFIKDKVSDDLNFQQIKRKIKHIRERYVAIEKKKKAGEVFTLTPRVKECYELSKPIYESGGEPTDDGGGGEAVRVRVEEHGEGTDGAVEEPEEEDVGEKQKEIDAVETKEKKKKKTKAGAAEERRQENIHVNIEKQKEVETKEKNNNKKRKAGAGDEKLTPSTDNLKELDEKEMSKKKKKKKKRKVANADSVSEILIAQLTKASWSFRLLLNEETKKAIKSIEPSKVVSLTQEVKNFEVEKEKMLLKEADLVHKLAEVLSGTVIEPSQVVSITQESKNFEVEQMEMLWKQVALVRKVSAVLSS